MTVIVDGIAIDYEVRGRGPTIVLLHGWADTKNTFDKLIPVLEKQYTVVRLDLPGFGKTDRPKKVFNLQKYAEIISSFLVKIDVKKVYAFVGHSNGGAIAIKGLATGAFTSKKAILIASSGIRGEFKTSKKLMRMAVKTAKIPTLLLPKKTKKKLRSKVYEKIGSDMLIAEHMQETFKNIVGEDLLDEAAMINCACLFIYGSEDTSTPVRYGELFARQIEKAKLLTIENADHFLHQTHSTEVSKLINEYLGAK